MENMGFYNVSGDDQKKLFEDGNKINASKRHLFSIVSGITAFRVLLAALFLYLFVNDLQIWAIGFLIFACFTDGLDGRLARRFGVSTSFGAYFDVTADFLLVLLVFSAFVLKEIYPFWTLLIISFVFLQFILTAMLCKQLYDPVGGFYGGFLLLAIGFTLIFPSTAVYNIILILIPIYAVMAVVSRSVFLLNCKKKGTRD